MQARGALLLLIAVVFCGWPWLARGQEWIYTVRPGDNLWTLSEELLVDMRYWRPLWALNAVDRPRQMPPGLRLRVPIAWMKVQPAPVRVAATSGRVDLVRAAEETRALRSGDRVRLGEAVVTGDDGSATLVFADGSRFLVEPSSRVVMDRLHQYGRYGMVDTRVRLERGRSSTGVPTDRDPDARFEIWTPAAVAAVRGTRFRIGVAADGAATATEVVEGTTRVRAEGVATRVAAGFGTLTRRGEPPGRPVPLLPAPDLSAMPAVFDSVPLRFAAGAVPGADRYRFQVSPTAAFEVLLFDAVESAPLFRGPDLPDGGYVLWVRAIDARGLEGLDAERLFEVDARPEPPILIQPIKETRVREPVPLFRWTEPEGAVSYRLQLARDEGFADLVVDREAVRGSTFVPESLAPGVYWWRIATRDGTGEVGPFGDAQVFELRPAPPAPELEETGATEDGLTLRWREGRAGQTYQVQIARDDGFEDVIVDREVDDAQIAVPKPDAGSYFIRVRTIDADGYRGPYGTTQRVDVRPEDEWWLLLLPFLFILLPLL